MIERATQHVFRGFWATSLGTLASRVLGLARDVATAALLGLGEAGVMDAFVVAFRIPNLLRRVFGEGALAASFLPVFSSQMSRSPRLAWQMFSVLLVWLAVVLSCVVLLVELACAAWWWVASDVSADGRLLLGLTAAMLPYVVFVCLAAQASAALQALLEFRVPALAPALLNVCWLAAVWLVCPWFESDKHAQAYVISGAVLVSGVLQLAVQFPALWRHGFRFDYDWMAGRQAVWLVTRTAAPVALGLAVTQINTLVDSLIAWGLAVPAADAPRQIAWLGGHLSYPLQTGAAAAVYYGERFYQLPVGILGVAIATVIYPLLSRHAARGDTTAVSSDLAIGLRLVTFAALPAGVGMMLVADPLVRLLFERGAFTSADASRAADMIVCYASGVWAYCAVPVLVRGFYATGRHAVPARLAVGVVALNLLVTLLLVWPLAERGLALGTAAAALVQAALLAAVFSRQVSPLDWSALSSTLVKSALATAAMALAVWAAQAAIGRSALPEIAVGAATYLVVARLLRMPELTLLARRPADDGDRGAGSSA